MGLLSFIKGAGEKLFHKGEAQAAQEAAKQAPTPVNLDAANRAAADAIVAYVKTQGLAPTGIVIAFDGASSTVTVSGVAPDQETKEKIVLCCGNVEGVEHVNDQMSVEIAKPEARFYKTGKPFIAIPGALGAHNWHPMSFNPATGLVYIPAQQIPQGYLQDMTELDKRKILGFNIGSTLTGTMLPDDKAAFKAAVAATTGRLVAFDPRTGKVAWAVDYPAAWNGGTMTTAGNLVFQGTSTGRFRAYTADTGKQLLDLDMQSGIVSASLRASRPAVRIATW